MRTRTFLRHLLFVVIVSAVGFGVPALYAAAITELAEYYSLTALSGTATAVDLGAQYPVIVVINDDTAIAIHVRGDGGVATTSSPKVKAGERYELPPPTTNNYRGRQNISVIAASGTPSCRIYGLP